MGRTPPPDTTRDPHGLDKLPANEPVRVVRSDDGTLTIRRERDDATWDGGQFVTTEPPLNRYAVTVRLNAIDAPTAVQIVADGLYDGKGDDAELDVEVDPTANLIAEGVG